MIVNLLALGIFSTEILEELFPNDDIILIFNSGLLYYIGIDFFMRLNLQDLPVLSVQPYLHLPIKRKSMAHYLLLRSLLSFFNFIPLFVIIPFAIRNIAPVWGGATSLIWILSIMFFVYLNNFLILFIKRQVMEKAWTAIIIGLVILGLAALQYFKIFNFGEISKYIFSQILLYPLLILVPIALVVGVYAVNMRFLLKHMYVEEISRKKDKGITAAGDIHFLKRFGKMGELIALEIKLMLRHKRTKNVLLMTLAFSLYGLFFYNQPKYVEGMGMLIFPGIFLSGIFLFNYGQYMLSWHSHWYDALLTRDISPIFFIRSRFWILVIMATFSFILSLPYIYYGAKVVWVNFACYLFNIGFNVFLIIYFASLSPKKIDLSKRGNMNSQGFNVSRILMMLVILVVPFIIFLPFKIFDKSVLGIIAIGAFGLISLLFSPFWIKMLAQRLDNQKYKITEAFHESEY